MLNKLQRAVSRDRLFACIFHWLNVLEDEVIYQIERNQHSSFDVWLFCVHSSCSESINSFCWLHECVPDDWLLMNAYTSHLSVHFSQPAFSVGGTTTQRLYKYTHVKTEQNRSTVTVLARRKKKLFSLTPAKSFFRYITTQTSKVTENFF